MTGNPEEEPPRDDESRGQSDGAGSCMGSDGSENEEDWQAGSEPHWHAGTHNLWLVEDHTTGVKVPQARSKPGQEFSGNQATVTMERNN